MISKRNADDLGVRSVLADCTSHLYSVDGKRVRLRSLIVLVTGTAKKMVPKSTCIVTSKDQLRHPIEASTILVTIMPTHWQKNIKENLKLGTKTHHVG